MIIKFVVSSDSNLTEILNKLKSSFISVINQSVTEHGNTELTVIADTKDQVLLISSIYFG